MNIFDQFCESPEDYYLGLLQASICYVKKAISDLRDEGNADNSEFEELEKATLADLWARVTAAVGAEQPLNPGGWWSATVAGRLTDGFIDDSEQPPLLDQYQRFVTALCCAHALKHLTRPAPIKPAARFLLYALCQQMELHSIRFSKQRGAKQVEDMILTDLDNNPLLKQWTDNPPTFSAALAAVRQRVKWRTQDAIEKVPKSLSEIDLKNQDKLPLRLGNLPENPFGRLRVRFTYHFYDALHEPLAKLIGKIANNLGQRLFLWLILGGMSHKKRSWQSREYPFLVQPRLIEALQERLGQGFRRNCYGRPFSKWTEQTDAPLWRKIVERLISVLTPLVEIDDGWQAYLDFLTEGVAARYAFTGLVQRATPPGAQFAGADRSGLSDSLAWDLLLATGDWVLFLIQAGKLNEYELLGSQLAAEADPVAVIRVWLGSDGSGDQVPNCDHVAAITRYLCEGGADREYWVRTFDRFSDKEKQ